ncbi:MAG: sugar ABC transporter permease, partial [Planctomycetota bacterium]
MVEKKKRIQQRPQSVAGWAFSSPWIVGFLLFFAWPFFATFYWSLCRFDLINPPQFVGLQNYQRIASEIGTQRGFGRALTNTIYYSLLSVPLSVITGVLLAVLLSAKIKGQAMYRTLIFLPSVIPVVAASILWLWLLDPQDGMVNYLITWGGNSLLPAQNWLNQSRSALSSESVAVFTNWFDGQPLKLLGSKDALVLMTLWG